MEALEAIRKRASLKTRFSAREIGQVKIDRILEAATLAPSTQKMARLLLPANDFSFPHNQVDAVSYISSFQESDTGGLHLYNLFPNLEPFALSC